MAKSVRAVAAQVLNKVLTEGQSLSQLLPEASGQLPERDQGLLQELCFGVCRQAHRLERQSRELLRKPLKSRDGDVLALIYLGLYQLFHLRTPDHAAISATVQAARELKKPWAASLINATLRSAQRQSDHLHQQLQHDLQYQHSHPQWLQERIRRAWPEHWQSVLTANNSHPPLTLRVNQQQTSRAQYLEALSLANLPAQATTHSPWGVQLEKAVNTQLLPGFAEGWASVQDEAAQLAAGLLQLAPGQRVLDACCAPGGKTSHILELEKDLLGLLALDSDAQRITRVQENLQRLGLKAQLTVADAGAPEVWWDGKLFDRILLDAPCSATGVIRRHPDIKLLRRANDIAKLVELQQRLLTALWPTLAPGGYLLYATCSVLPEENEQNVAAFLAQTESAMHCPIDATWGLERAIGRQILPEIDGQDGFYYALLQKKLI